jgi:hypothetical protein
LLHYLLNLKKVAAHAYRQRSGGFPPPGPVPHMPPEEVEFFKTHISQCKSYVEFGSGGSTVLASILGVPTISVESDGHYARAVASQLTGNSVIQIVSSLGLAMEWGMPAFPRVRLARRYVMAPWILPEFPDFVLVDGRYRVACALAAARRASAARAKTLLMLDDYFGRPFYSEVEQHLGSPRRVGRAAIFEIGAQEVPKEAVERWLQDPA